MTLDKELLGMIVTGLNNLEGDEFNNLTLKGLTVIEANHIKYSYLTNYEAKVNHSMKLNEGYVVEISKKK